MSLPVFLLPLLAWVDETPEPEDVTAGWLAFGLFGLSIVAVVLLGISLTRHLRKADRAQAEGVYDAADARRREARGR